MSRTGLALCSFAFLACYVGCVRRTLTVRTEPEGARIWVNDEDVGRSPVTVDFTWYGDYDIVCRKQGLQPLATHHRVNPPWYQIPPIDFFAEVLTPWTYEDHHAVAFDMEPETFPGRDELVERAKEMREHALFAGE